MLQRKRARKATERNSLKESPLPLAGEVGLSGPGEGFRFSPESEDRKQIPQPQNFSPWKLHGAWVSTLMSPSTLHWQASRISSSWPM